jgi:monoamine oxidase
MTDGVEMDFAPDSPMPHTPFARKLRELCSVAAESDLRQTPIDVVAHERVQRGLTRRAFVRRAAIGVTTLAAAPLISRAKPGGSTGRVVVIGAGLAGLTCAYRLKQAGIVATVYEANSRIGGRCWTRRNDFAEGQIAEHGGELIDQGHTSIRQLAQELRLPLDNLLAAEVNGTEPFFYFDGSAYSYADATTDLKAIWQTVHRDLSAASYPTQYNRYTPAGAQLDQMSVADWIEFNVPGGLSSRLGQLLDVAYNIEYGAETGRQSALNLLYLLGYNSPGQFSVFGQSNEKYHVRGGNDQIAARLADALGSQLVTGAALTAVKLNAGGSYTLTLQSGAKTFGVTADHVVFALPFSILNTGVDLKRAGFSPLKRMAIRELAMGSNSKLNVQFARRSWITRGNNGDLYGDTGFQAAWEVTRAQPGTAGILVGYSGGTYADTFGKGTPASRALQFLSQIEPIVPGVSAQWNGRATVDYWAGDPYTRGSYSYWQVGQYTRFSGIEGVAEGNAHFCGEHTSIDSQGYLNGAVETGERAAGEIIGA